MAQHSFITDVGAAHGPDRLCLSYCELELLAVRTVSIVNTEKVTNLQYFVLTASSKHREGNHR